MARYFKNEINFLGKRKIFFTISLILILISVGSLLIKGLNLGVEFSGGSTINFIDAEDVTIEEMREACNEAGIDNPVIQTSSTGGKSGFVVRTSNTDATAVTAQAVEVINTLGLDESTYEVNSIGPDWGVSILQSSLTAFLVAMLLIIIYIAIRFEWKMGVTAILGLVHDLVIVIGIYSLFGREITPNVIAALLTIMGYSLYDSVVVFHRINENASPNMHHSYITISNHSINQVFTRTINTTLTSLIPVLAMLLFGGETLKDFAFAMVLGLILGSYSSIAFATPLYAMWKTREPAYAKLAIKYGEGIGDFSNDMISDVVKNSSSVKNGNQKIKSSKE